MALSYMRLKLLIRSPLISERRFVVSSSLGIWNQRVSHRTFSTKDNVDQPDQPNIINLKHINNIEASIGKTVELEVGAIRPSCASCGISLQYEDPNSEGFCRTQKVHDPSKFQKDTALAAGRERLLLEQLQQLEGITGDSALQIEMKKGKPKRKVKDRRPTCQRCLDAHYHSAFDPRQHKYVSVDSVLSTIPKNANILYVLSALDFPLTLSRKAIQGRDPKNVWYAITKTDAFFDQKQSLHNAGGYYFADALAKLVNADREKVLLVSGKLGWSTSNLLERLPKGTLYIVGEVNSGKSTLVRTLVYNDDKTLRKKDAYGPGISHLPCFTRTNTKYELPYSDMTLVDTPGYSPDNKGPFQYLIGKAVSDAVDIVQYSAPLPKRHASFPINVLHRKDFNGEQVYTCGGLFYLRPPPGSVFKRWKGIFGKEAKYQSLERALEVSLKRPSEIKDRFCVTHEAAEKLVRYVIPPFYGSVDLVFRGLGFFTITPTSRKLETELYEVFVPEGIDVMLRENIFGFIYKTPNPNWSTDNENRNEPKFRSRKLNTHKVVFSKLYPVPSDISREEAYKRVLPPSPSGTTVLARSQDEFDNRFWKYPDFE